MLFLRVHEIKKHMFLFHYGKHKEIYGNHNQRTSMLPINVLFFLVPSIIVGYWKHFLCLRADKKKNKYLPNKNVWLNKLYFQISNSQEKKCLTIDTRDVNKFGAGKFKMSADNGEEQTCYFNRNKSDTHFTSFVARRTKAEPIRFSIVKQIFDFDFVNKSLDISARSSVSDGELKRKLQQDSSESFNNGRFKNERRTDSDRL